MTRHSRETRSSNFKILELEKVEYRVQRSRKNSPMSGQATVRDWQLHWLTNRNINPCFCLKCLLQTNVSGPSLSKKTSKDYFYFTTFATALTFQPSCFWRWPLEMESLLAFKCHAMVGIHYVKRLRRVSTLCKNYVIPGSRTRKGYFFISTEHRNIILKGSVVH